MVSRRSYCGWFSFFPLMFHLPILLFHSMFSEFTLPCIFSNWNIKKSSDHHQLLSITKTPIDASKSPRKTMTDEDDEATPIKEAFAEFLRSFPSHSEQLRAIILSPDPRLHYPLEISYVQSSLPNFVSYSSSYPICFNEFWYLFDCSFAVLLDYDRDLAHHVYYNPVRSLRSFDEAAVSVQVSVVFLCTDL